MLFQKLLFQKLCALGLLCSSLMHAPMTGLVPTPCLSQGENLSQGEGLSARAAPSVRLATDRRSTVRYVVQKASSVNEEGVEPKVVAQYYGAKALGPEGTWTLKNGVTVAGRAFETPHLGLLRIWKRSSEAPAEVYVRLEDFTESDQVQLKRFMSKYGSAVRFQHLPIIAYEIKRWQGTAPKDRALVSRVVALEDGQIFFLTDQQLLTVPESAVDPAEVAVLKQQFQQHGSGRYLEVKKFTRVPFAGKLIAETDDYFVLQTREPSPRIGFRYPKETRYRVPKYLMSDLLVRQLQAIMKRFSEELANQRLSPADLSALPCLRQTGKGAMLCYPTTKPNERTLEILTEQGTRQAMRVTDLACTDRVAVEYEALVNSGKSPSDELRTTALVTVADDLGEQSSWQLKNAAPIYFGAPLGAVDNGFALATIGGKQPVFVKASQLEDVDRKLLEIAYKQHNYKWLVDVDPTQLFQTRLIVVQQTARLFKAESQIQLNAAITGEFASPNSDKSQSAQSLSGVHVDSLFDAGDGSVYIEKYAPLLASNNRTAALEKIAAMRQTSGDPLPDLGQHVPVIKREAWSLGNNQAIVFHGVLTGKWGEDFVFSDDFDGKKKHFLAASSDLSDDSRERADELVARLPAQDWEKIVARAENWQYFRIWYDAKSRRTLSSYPCVIAELRSFGPAVQNIDGKTHTLLWSQVGGEVEGKLMLERALKQGLANREKAEQGIPSWTFKDCSQTLVAQFVGAYEDDVVLRDVNGTEFLMFNMSFDEASQQQLARLSKENTNQQPLSQAQRYKMPRMWCSYDKLLGPAQLLNYVEMSRAWLMVKNTSQSTALWTLSSLSRRERLATKALWLRQSRQLEDDRSFDALLSQPVGSDAIISKTPDLLPDLKQRIDKAWDDHLSQLTWQSAPIKVDAEARIIAVDRDATGGIVVDADDKWQAVDFSSGKVHALQEWIKEAPTFGPWLHQGTEQVWWVEQGRLKKWQAGGQVAEAIPESKLTITLADQSGDFESLVLHFSDDSIAKLELSTGRSQPLRPAPGRIMPHNAAQLVTSLDGSAVLIARQNSVESSVFSRNPNEAGGHDFAGIAQPLRSLAVSRNLAVGMTEDSPQLFAMSSAVQGIRPETLNLPFVPQLFGFVNLGKEAEEELQAIGKLDGKFSSANDWAYVYTTSIDGQRRKYQIIEGEFGENAVLAGNGAAVVHKKGGGYVVSRRPAEIPQILRGELYDLAEQLLVKLDIGQLEAVARYLEQPKFQTDCAYAGETAHAYFDLLWVSCLEFQPHIGGDRMERARLVIEKLLEKFPASHVARNLLVAWHRDRAWDARGGGYADTVSEKGWEIFHSGFQQAQKELKPLLGQADTIAATYASAIDIAVATGAPLDSMRKLAMEILRGPHAGNVRLHKAVMQYLLPRWHGQPGMSEAYAVNVASQLERSNGDAIYAKLICEISSFQGPNGPVTVDMDLDLERLSKGTKDYYQTWNDPNVMDMTLLLLSLAKETNHIEELLRLRAEKRILPGSTARAGWKTYRAIEASIEEN